MLAFFGVIVAQPGKVGVMSGNLINEKSEPLSGATIVLTLHADTLQLSIIQTDSKGDFKFSLLKTGYYFLKASYIGKRPLRIDSIHVRAERLDFNIPDIMMKNNDISQLEQVVIYAEKPLIESRDGNLTFNVTESANAAGATAGELLTQMPLVSKDADGKITVRGKEPRILIDDKPVELNLQQLQDLLESLPGSSIEKIEVMTNPPPQYANEQGGVINIVMRKGRIGKSGRIGITAGTRGELSLSGSYNYKKKGLTLAVNAGWNQNRFRGQGYSTRQNRYTDSTNYLSTSNQNHSQNKRPSLRVNIDYQVTPKSMLNGVLQLNQNAATQFSGTRFTTINHFDIPWRITDRSIYTVNNNWSPSLQLNYTFKPKPGHILRILTNWAGGQQDSDRDFFQYYLRPDGGISRQDSIQKQAVDNLNRGGSLRLLYDKTWQPLKLTFSGGALYNFTITHALTNASYQKMPEQIYLPLPLLSNDFVFTQGVSQFRVSLKKVIGENFSVTGGISVEKTQISFDIRNENKQVENQYPTWLPFFNFNKSWKDRFSATLSYRRSINRPGMQQLNPVLDFADPFNLRFGNPNLQASTIEHFNLVLSRNRAKYFLNLGMGYHQVNAVFSQVRTLVEGGKTEITWENISSREELEVSTWNGFTLAKKLKLNASASFTYMKYGIYDRMVRKFRNGPSFTTTLGQQWTPHENWNLTSNFNLNRFATPQGFARWNSSLTVGIQAKFLAKKLVTTFNMIDPLMNQERRNFTYGPNFSVESYSMTYTRNYRFSIAYVISGNKGGPKSKSKN